MRAALSSFSLLRCRFFSNDVRRAVDERAGVQIRSVPAELKTVTTRNACTKKKKKKKKKKKRCVVSSRSKEDEEKKSGR